MIVLTLVLQLALTVLSAVLSKFAFSITPFIPDVVLGSKYNPLSFQNMKVILAVFLIAHFIAYLISFYVNRAPLFSSFKRTLDEIYFVILAITCSIYYLFIFTTISFSIKYFLFMFLISPLLYTGMFFLVHRLWRPALSEHYEQSFLSDFWAFVCCRKAVATGVVMLSPALLAFYYVRNTDFRNFINYTRVSMNVTETSRWVIREAYPGRYFDQPIDFQFAPQEPTHLYVLERPGRLYRVITAPTWKQELMLDIRDKVGGTELENGALSFALHPSFGLAGSPNQGSVYVYYTHTQPGVQRNRLVRFELSFSDVDQRVKSEIFLIEQDRIPNGFHNGGKVLFGPDGFLYLSLGNFGDRMNPQRVDTLAGSILRLDVDERGEPISNPIKRHPSGGKTAHYFIPKTNPFYGDSEALEELWAIGLRNPFRMAFDPDTGDLWLGDVGDEWYEEVNKVTAGSNGQSPFQEGRFVTPYARPKVVWGKELLPHFFYRQSSLDRAVIGGLVYRGEVYPELKGHYIFADNQSGILRAFDLSQPTPNPFTLARVNQLGQYGITSIQSTPSGAIYISILGSPERSLGQIMQLVKNDASLVAEPSSLPGDTPTYESVSSKYDMLCARCHGTDGRGEALTALDKRPNFSRRAWQQRVSDDYIKTVIYRGGAAMGLSGQMPSWANAFTEAELDIMVKKIRSFGNGTESK